MWSRGKLCEFAKISVDAIPTSRRPRLCADHAATPPLRRSRRSNGTLEQVTIDAIAAHSGRAIRAFEHIAACGQEQLTRSRV